MTTTYDPNSCVICNRTRIMGGVFVAGLGPICFECEEREFGVDLDQSTGGDDVRQKAREDARA